jgi:NAD-dependent dihydropyrimidine dehydrogenase PreA subunit
MVDVVSVDAAS